MLDGGRALSTGGAHSQGHAVIGEGGPAGAMTKLGEGATGELGGQVRNGGCSPKSNLAKEHDVEWGSDNELAGRGTGGETV